MHKSLKITSMRKCINHYSDMYTIKVKKYESFVLAQP